MALHLLYAIDILISFRVAFTENEILVTNRADVAKNYRRYLRFILSAPLIIPIPIYKYFFLKIWFFTVLHLWGND